MWFLAKRAKKKSSPKGKAQFLRKALPKRREGRVLTGESAHNSRVFISIFLLWLLFFTTLFYVAFFSPFFFIGIPRMSGMNKIAQEALNTSLESQLAGKYLGIFPKRNFFLLRPRALEDFLRREYPLLAAAAVTRVFPDGLSLVITEREKIILWCSQGPPQLVSESGDPSEVEAEETVLPVERGCFLIDEAGRAKDTGLALSEENISAVLFITDTSGRAVAEGERVFDPSYGIFVIRMSQSFPEQTGIGLGVEYTTVSRFANEVRAKTSEGWEVYVNTEIPIETSLNALKLLFEKELPQEKRTGLAYIDVRTENRVYYAFREGADTMKAEEGAPSDTSAPEKKDSDPKKSKQ